MQAMEALRARFGDAAIQPGRALDARPGKPPDS
jgi:hypothetical protein